MEKTGTPYIISFVISRNGHILDGTSLSHAIELIDSETNQKTSGYMVNRAYPSFLCAPTQPKRFYDRLIGFQANASSLDHCDLDGAEELETDDISDWIEPVEALRLMAEIGKARLANHQRCSCR